MTALRRRMVEDLQLRGLAPKTQQCYVDAVKQLAQHYRRSPDQISEEELRQYFLFLLNEKQVADSTFRIHLYGIKFLYERTLQRPWPVVALVRQECPDLTIPESVWTTEWVVYGKPTVQGTEHVLNYLGRYVYRVALTNNRILSIEDGQVCFRYQDSRKHCWKIMILPALEFIRRFLQHVLPRGFHKVRSYGLWSPVHRSLLHQLQLSLASQAPPAPRETPDRESQPHDSRYPPLQAGQRCPHCDQGLLVVIRLLPRLQREPP